MMSHVSLLNAGMTFLCFMWLTAVIHQVLELILENLDSVSLFNCRSVSKQWNQSATKILNFRQETTINVEYVRDSFRVTSGLYRGTELKNLSIYITTFCNGNFPWTTFYIQGLAMEDVELQSFLSCHGWNIKSLDIDFRSVRLNEIKRLLVEQVPNLEDLSMYIHEFLDSNLRLFSEPKEELTGVLKNLKTLYFIVPPPKQVVQDLLRVCGRIKRVTRERHWANIPFPGKMQRGISWNSTSPAKMTSCVSTFYLKRILESDRSYILKNLDIRFSITEDDPEGKVKKFCSNFLNSNPALSRLRICRENSYFCKAYTSEEIIIISKLLTSTAATLKVLYIPPLSFLERIKFPKLPELHHLGLNHGNGPAFPPPAVFNVSAILPRLTTMTIDCSDSSNTGPDLVEEMQFFFQNLMDHSLRSVTTVELQFSDLHCPLLLASIDFNIAFPNLTQLFLLSPLSDFPNEAKALWTLSKRKNLEITIQLNREGNSYPALDCGFTGFSKETCKQLYEATYDEDSSGLQAFRQTKSLLDLESLEFLTLEIFDFFANDQHDGDHMYPLPIITAVTGRFAFAMCPWLRIKLCGTTNDKDRFASVLKAIIPYVHSVHWKDFELE